MICKKRRPEQQYDHVTVSTREGMGTSRFVASAIAPISAPRFMALATRRAEWRGTAPSCCMLADDRGDTLAGNCTDTGREFPDGGKQGVQENHDPQLMIPELGAGLRERGDAGRIIIGRPGNQTWPQNTGQSGNPLRSSFPGMAVFHITPCFRSYPRSAVTHCPGRVSPGAFHQTSACALLLQLSVLLFGAFLALVLRRLGLPGHLYLLLHLSYLCLHL